MANVTHIYGNEVTDAAARGSLAPAYSASSTYAVGDLVLHEGQLYECSTAISTAEEWTTAHWTAKTVADEVSSLKGGLTDKLDAPSTAGTSGQVLATDGEGGTYWTNQSGGGSGLTNDIKQALLQLAAKVAYIDDDGQDYYDDLHDALYTLVSISAVYTQSGTVYTSDSLDSLKSDLVVTALFDDQSTETVTNYTLSGTLAVGTSTITVTYGGKTTTFNVTVSSYWDYEWDSSSETLPSGMTAKSYDFTTEQGALYVQEPNLDFDYIGDAELEIVMKWYTDSSLQSAANNPQIVLKRGTKDGIKAYGGKTTNNKIFSNISGSNTATESYDNVYHTINIKGTGSSYILKIDDETLTGSGVTNNNYLSFTGIVCNTTNNYIFAAYIKSIKFKRIQ